MSPTCCWCALRHASGNLPSAAPWGRLARASFANYSPKAYCSRSPAVCSAWRLGLPASALCLPSAPQACRASAKMVLYVAVDWRVLVFTLAVSLATGILFGLFPAWTASRTDLNSVLKESSSRSGSGFRQGRTRALLVISQVSLALVLLIGSVLLIRTFIALQAVEPGFRPHNVLTLEMSLNGSRFQKTAGVAQLLRNGRERLNAIPGVDVSAAAYWLPDPCWRRAPVPDRWPAGRQRSSVWQPLDEYLAWLSGGLQHPRFTRPQF